MEWKFNPSGGEKTRNSMDNAEKQQFKEEKTARKAAGKRGKSK